MLKSLPQGDEGGGAPAATHWAGPQVLKAEQNDTPTLSSLCGRDANFKIIVSRAIAPWAERRGALSGEV